VAVVAAGVGDGSRIRNDVKGLGRRKTAQMHTFRNSNTTNYHHDRVARTYLPYIPSTART
jgi:hypothetical protein